MTADVKEIVAAAKRLKPAQFDRLRRELDRIEEIIWQAELERASKSMKEKGITDRAIDRMVLRRRGESRR